MLRQASLACIGLVLSTTAWSQSPAPQPLEATTESQQPPLQRSAVDADGSSASFSVTVLGRDGEPAAPQRSELLASHLESPLEVRSVRPSDPDATRIVVYFDAALSSTAALRSVADALSAVVEDLVRLGRVQIVLADPVPQPITPETRDPELIANALQRIFLRTEAQDLLRGRREAFLAGRSREEFLSGIVSDTGRRDLAADRRTELAREALEDELFLLDAQQQSISEWLIEETDHDVEASYLLLVQDGFGVDPTSFYLAEAPDVSIRDLVSSIPSSTLLAEAMAAHGWVLFPIRRADRDAEIERGLRYAPDEDVAVGFRLTLGRDRDRGDSDEADLLPAPVDRWQLAAAATGGHVVAVNEFETLPRSLQRRRLVEVAFDSESLPEQIEWALGSGETTDREPTRRQLLAPQRVPLHYHPLTSSVRLSRAFAGELDAEGDIVIDSTLTLDTAQASGSSGLLEATLRFDAASDAPSSETGAPERTASMPTSSTQQRWRVSVLFANVDGTTSSQQFPVTATRGDLARTGLELEESEPIATAQLLIDGTQAQLRAPLAVPSGTNAVGLLLLRERDGSWGYAAPRLRTRTDISDTAGETSPSALRLLPPSGSSLSGRVTFEVETTDDVDRVVYYLGGKRVARRSRPPFDVTINLGSTPRTLLLVAAAFDRSGTELARDRVMLNEPPEAFWIRITAPEPGADVAGPTEISAQLKVPEGARVDAVDFYWKEQRLASLEEPPFEATLRLPVGEPDGFLRAEARLRDGRLAEDVLLVNQGGFGEQIGVELVELYVVATDRNSKPVLGLDRSDFEVFEDGRPQQVEDFEVAGDLPLTIGLAIDSSSSLFLRMPEVRNAAAGFVQSLSASRDRAFLVGFGSEPKLIAGTTRDLGHIETAITRLEPYGTTAVWGAMDLALQQLDGVRGRKALVVFYDGDDEDEERFFERSLRLARRSNVPIYVILMNDMAARTDGRSLSSRSFAGKLDRITRAGGGRVYFVRKDEALEPIFEAIAEELRSHYLLTYYPEIRPGGPLWRPVEVRVQQRGVEARTIEGRGVEGY